MSGDVIFSVVFSCICAFVTAMTTIDKKCSNNIRDFIKKAKTNFIRGGIVTATSLILGVFLLFFLKKFVFNEDLTLSPLADFLSFTIGELIGWSISIVFFMKQLYKMKDIMETVGDDNSPYHFHYDGVFAVSAIVVSPDYDKFILVKRKSSSNDAKQENLWVQPGAYYRTNTIESEVPQEDLPAFYEFITNEIHKETGLHEGDYEPIFINNIFNSNTPKPYDYSVRKGNESLHENKLFQPALFIQKEFPYSKDKRKSSNTKIHIDSFYAFRLKKEIDEERLKELMSFADKTSYHDLKLFSLDEIITMADNNECYQDIVEIINKFLKLFRKDLFEKKYKLNIRYCTFNPKNSTLWLRLNDNCNLNCSYCLLPNRNRINSKPIKIKNFEKFINNNRDIKKKSSAFNMVLTGGEPFLIENFSSFVSKVLQYNWVKKISICTNGTSQRKIETFVKAVIVPERNNIRFVLNMPACNANDYHRITSKDEFAKQEAVVKYLLSKNIPVTANIVLTKTVKNTIKDYFRYWTDLGIKNIAFSYAIRIGINSRESVNSEVLSKTECINLFYSIGNGDYPIEKFDSIELMIPSCDELCCGERGNVISCYIDSKGEFKRNKNENDEDCCLDTYDLIH